MPENCEKMTVHGGLPTIVTAHSGFAAAGGARDKSEDNTMDNIIKALNHAPDAIEIDVHYIDTDGDGAPDALWLGHDCANAAVNPPAEDVLLLLLGRHPRSAEVTAPTDKTRIQLDLKTPDSIFAAIALAEKVGLAFDRLILAGEVDYNFVKENHARLLPYAEQGMELWMSPRGVLGYQEDVDAVGEVDRFIDLLQALRMPHVVVNTHYALVSDEIKAKLDAAGLPVSIWTLNSSETIASQLERGMYNVTSRLPECLARRNALRGE
ncbi:MAG: hypothetical protein IJ452_02095 [Butyricicoccus sp.]|nr:hypothetical protein [Butyricicoccus sp.]MBQ8585059.1 hypothetical protein [Butyricicoccus sp.]